MVHRRAEFRASQIMVERVRDHQRIEILSPVVEEVLGSTTASSRAPAPQQRDRRDMEDPTDGLFVAIGHDPTTKLRRPARPRRQRLPRHQGKTTETNIPGVFAAGDVVDHVYRQAITAAGSGCIAALDAERLLAEARVTPRPPSRRPARKPTTPSLSRSLGGTCRSTSARTASTGRSTRPPPGAHEQAIACERCGFGFLFELLDDYYPAPTAGLVVCDATARILAVGRGVFELTGYRDGS